MSVLRINDRQIDPAKSKSSRQIMGRKLRGAGLVNHLATKWQEEKHRIFEKKTCGAQRLDEAVTVRARHPIVAAIFGASMRKAAKDGRRPGAERMMNRCGHSDTSEVSGPEFGCRINPNVGFAGHLTGVTLERSRLLVYPIARLFITCSCSQVPYFRRVRGEPVRETQSVDLCSIPGHPPPARRRAAGPSTLRCKAAPQPMR